MPDTTRSDAARIPRQELSPGLTAQFEREITAADVERFCANSGDWNPLHIDADYASASNYGGRIVHGAMQTGLASAMIGMHLPGREVLLASIQAKFPNPLYYPCKVRVRGEITSWNPGTKWGILRVTVEDVAKTSVTAEVTMGFTLHGVPAASAVTAPASSEPSAGTREGRCVLVTGASGGVGEELVRGLLPDYAVVALCGSKPLAADLAEARVTSLSVDLMGDTWERELDVFLAGRALYGIVHAAWPGVPQGSLLDSPGTVIETQLVFAARTMTRLARFLRDRITEDGGRLIAIGSVAGSHKPVLPLAAYSLGKSALEHCVRLIAPEVARKNICVNAVCPSFIPAGVHKHASDRQRLKETAAVPLGRLCTPADVAAACRFLLSNDASFLSGQIVGLNGAQL